jgi:predicted S18 family serine protease
MKGKTQLELEETVVELVEVVRAMHHAQAEQANLLASVIGALDAVTAAYTVLAEQVAELHRGPADVIEDSRALRGESQQARRQAESVRERARSLAAMASELKGTARELTGEASRETLPEQ